MTESATNLDLDILCAPIDVNLRERDFIEKHILGPYFPWFWQEKTITTNDYLQLGGFTHKFFTDNKINSKQYFYLIELILKELLTNKEITNKIKFKNIIRAQANLICNVENDEKEQQKLALYTEKMTLLDTIIDFRSHFKDVDYEIMQEIKENSDIWTCWCSKGTNNGRGGNSTATPSSIYV
jgi:hypothetical protein